MLGEPAEWSPRAIPAVIFTDPEIAWAGLTQKEAEAQNVPHEVLKFPWAASGRAVSIARTEGLTKMLVDPESKRVLGVGIVGAGAGEMIAEGVLAIEMGAVARDVMESIHPHPTLSETVMESAELAYGAATHVAKPQQGGEVRILHVRKHRRARAQIDDTATGNGVQAQSLRLGQHFGRIGAGVEPDFPRRLGRTSARTVIPIAGGR